MTYAPQVDLFATGASAFPYPTNSWWSSWSHNRTIGSTRGVGDEPVQMHPWRARVMPSYLELVPPGVQWDVKVRAPAGAWACACAYACACACAKHAGLGLLA